MLTLTDFAPAEVAAAGGHNLLVKHGDSGKAAQPSRTLDPGKVVLIRPSTTATGIFGKLDHGAKGALESAHQGTVILDDATRFDPAILDGIRNAHDAKRVRLYKGRDIAPNVNEPADFRLIIGTRGQDLRKISGPLLDRIDITTETAESTQADPAALAAAREAQANRLTAHGHATNAAAPLSLLLGALHPGRTALHALDEDLDRARVSLRGYLRILRLSWTLADLAGQTTPGAEEIEAARALRSF